MTSLGGCRGALLLVALAGCSSVGVEPDDGCVYGGVSHPPGSTFPATDGCNSCTCGTNGQVGCTLAACIGDGGDACVYGGKFYSVGATFPSSDGCNSCECSATGAVTCTERACSDPCVLGQTITFGQTGGNVLYVDVATLSAEAIYTYSRMPSGLGTGVPTPTPALACAPAMPACMSSDAVDTSDIKAGLADADVQLALTAATPPIYGVDSRPYDGSILQVKYGTGAFLVGSECPSPTLSSCRPIPRGVAKLVAELEALNQQQLADPTCANLR